MMDTTCEVLDLRPASTDVVVSRPVAQGGANAKLDLLGLCIAGTSGLISGGLFIYLGLFVRSLHSGTVPGYALIAFGLAAPLVAMIGMAAFLAPDAPRQTPSRTTSP